MALATINTGPANTQFGDPRSGVGKDVQILAGSELNTDTINETTAGSGVTIDGMLVKDGEILVSATGKRNEKIATVAVTGAAGSSGVFASWTNPEAGTILVSGVILDVVTQSTGAATVDIGTTATSATTTSDNLIDGLSTAAAGVFTNVSSAGTNGKAGQRLATGKFLNVAEASGDVNGLVGVLYIRYIVV